MASILNKAHHTLAVQHGGYGVNCSIDFWQYTSSYREQPDVNYLNRLLVQIHGESAGSIWSSFSNLNSLLQANEIATPVIQVSFQAQYHATHDKRL